METQSGPPARRAWAPTLPTYSPGADLGPGAALDFSGSGTDRLARQAVGAQVGRIPLRVESWAEMRMAAKVRDEASVDYVISSHGFLTPVSVVHRHPVDAQFITENLYSYDAFKLFTADAEIKFTEVPEAPAPAQK